MNEGINSSESAQVSVIILAFMALCLALSIPQ